MILNKFDVAIIISIAENKFIIAFPNPNKKIAKNKIPKFVLNFKIERLLSVEYIKQYK